MPKESPLDPSTTYNPASHPGVDRWHRENNPPPATPPGSAPRENVEHPEKSKDGR